MSSFVKHKLRSRGVYLSCSPTCRFCVVHILARFFKDRPFQISLHPSKYKKKDGTTFIEQKQKTPTIMRKQQKRVSEFLPLLVTQHCVAMAFNRRRGLVFLSCGEQQRQPTQARIAGPEFPQVHRLFPRVGTAAAAAPAMTPPLHTEGGSETRRQQWLPRHPQQASLANASFYTCKSTRHRGRV